MAIKEAAGIKYERTMERLLPNKSQTTSILATQLATPAADQSTKMAVPPGDRQQVPGGAPLAAPRHATKAGYQAPDLSRDCLSEFYREVEDLFGTTAPEPLHMSDQAFADVLKSLDECLRTGDEASEAEVEHGNHPSPEGGPIPGTA